MCKNRTAIFRSRRATQKSEWNAVAKRANFTFRPSPAHFVISTIFKLAIRLNCPWEQLVLFFSPVRSTYHYGTHILHNSSLSFFESLSAPFPVFRRKFKAHKLAIQFFRHDCRCATAEEGIEHSFPLVCRDQNESFENRLRHLATVPAFPLLEGAAHTRNVPCVLVETEFLPEFLRSQDPCVIGNTTLRVGTFIVVDQLPGTRHPNGFVMECKLVRIFDKMK